MKLAAVYPESQGYPLDDPPVMAVLIHADVLRLCAEHHIEPIGTLECATAEDVFTGERVLRWDFTPAEP